MFLGPQSCLTVPNFSYLSSMKYSPALIKFFFALFAFVAVASTSAAQIPPPGYERELSLMKAQGERSPLDRDSITVVDTITVFDPETYEETVRVIESTYSLRNYCADFLGMTNPDILLDGKPHTIIDPKTYQELQVRYIAGSRKIEILKVP